MTQESKILLKPFINQEEMRTFFSSSQNERFFYLTYPEYCQIFAFHPNPDYLPQINKRILYGHFDFFNQSYDSLYLYKWIPLLLKFLYNTGYFI